MSGVRLRIVIPWFCTGVGKIGMASATRFCTMTRAVFKLVPTSKVTVKRVRTVVAHLRGHVEHAFHAVDLLLDRRGDGVGHDLGAGARIDDGYRDRRRRDLGILRDRAAKSGRSRRPG